MERIIEEQDTLIDLGVASEATMGANGEGVDDFSRQILPGLADD